MPLQPLTREIVAQTLARGEDTGNEFKSVARGLLPADDLAAEIVALANSGGGRLWLGIEDDGAVSGIGDRKRADELLQLLDNACRHNVEPPIACRHEKLDHDGQMLLVTEVTGFSPDRPYRTNRGIYYVRGGASRRAATTAEIRRLVQSAASSALVPDEFPVQGTRFEDLDLARFREFHRKAYGDEAPTDREELQRLVATLKILTPEGPSILGLLCFGLNPQQFIPWARISGARSPGVEVGLEYTDRKDFGGTLDAQITAAEEFIVRHLPSPSRIDGFASEIPTPSLPIEAIREVVRNAVAHRDYAVKSQILITVYDDRVEVASPGQLLNSVTVDAIRLGVHVERNPLIAGFMAKSGLMTERGSGLPRVMRLMRERGLPEPEIEERGPSLLVTLRTKPRAV